MSVSLIANYLSATQSTHAPLLTRPSLESLASDLEVPNRLLSGFLRVSTLRRRRNFLSRSPLTRQFDRERLSLLFGFRHANVSFVEPCKYYVYRATRVVYYSLCLVFNRAKATEQSASPEI